MKKYTQILAVMLMASVGANVFAGDIPQPPRQTFEEWGAAQRPEGGWPEVEVEPVLGAGWREFLGGGKQLEGVKGEKVLPGVSTGWRAYMPTSTLGKGGLAAVLFAAAVAAGYGFKQIYNYFKPGKPVPATEEQARAEIEAMLSNEEKKQAAELAEEIVQEEVVKEIVKDIQQTEKAPVVQKPRTRTRTRTSRTRTRR